MTVQLVADGGELTVLRSLAAYAYGAWSVEWPTEVPEDDRPELDDNREFGYVSRLGFTPGRMGRRFVREDLSIQAHEVGDDKGEHSGYSNVEETLDQAANRTTGDTFFQFEFTREHLGRLIPYVDFNVGDMIDVVIWGRIIPAPVVSIQAVTDLGAIVDWKVRVGGTLISDSAALDRTFQEIRRDIMQERRERQDAVTAESKSRTVAISTERREREADVQTVRDLLGGKNASDMTLLSQLAAVNAQIINMGEKPPPPGLLNSYMSLNTLLWEQQQQINRLNEKFRAEVRERQRRDAIVDARQDEALRRAQTAIDNEEKYRMWPGAGPANSAWFSPRNNPFVEVRAEGNTSTARLKRRCTGYIQLMQKMTDGRMDMWGWNVNHPAGTTFELSGGGLLKVEQFFILYQLWEP